ncbi:hypothetical protein D8S78_07930 [Natrialba swarupiae]|nr:hypothetical protein [Natrialba swarupiae]
MIESGVLTRARRRLIRIAVPVSRRSRKAGPDTAVLMDSKPYDSRRLPTGEPTGDRDPRSASNVSTSLAARLT